METSPDRTRRSGGHARTGPLLRTRDAEAAPPRHRAPVGSSRDGKRARPRRSGPVLLAAGAAGVAVLLAGGSALMADGDDARPSAPAAAAQPSEAVDAASPEASPRPAADAALSAAVSAATAAGRTPTDARAALEEQLAARAAGNLALLRSTWAGDEAAAARAARALATSSTGLSAVVTAWRDTDLAIRLRTGLDEQSQASRAYAAAVASGDVTAADEARARMGEVSRDLGAVLDTATDGRIAAYVPPQDAAKYRAYVDALQAKDVAAADEAAEWLRGRLTREGAALATSLAGGAPS